MEVQKYSVEGNSRKKGNGKVRGVTGKASEEGLVSFVLWEILFRKGQIKSYTQNPILTGRRIRGKSEINLVGHLTSRVGSRGSQAGSEHFSE